MWARAHVLFFKLSEFTKGKKVLQIYTQRGCQDSDHLFTCSLAVNKAIDSWCMQGLDPVTIASIFSTAEHAGEKQVDGEDCFVLRLDVGPSVLSSWSDGTAEVIRHGLTGFFSQRSGLLARLEDSQLTRIQSPGAPAMYWETTIASAMSDYRAVDGGGGVAVAHAGTSTAHLARFGVGVRAARVVTRMEESWTIDDVAFNVPGLGPDAFIPPEEVRRSRSYGAAIAAGK